MPARTGAVSDGLIMPPAHARAARPVRRQHLVFDFKGIDKLMPTGLDQGKIQRPSYACRTGADADIFDRRRD